MVFCWLRRFFFVVDDAVVGGVCGDWRWDCDEEEGIIVDGVLLMGRAR